MSHYFTDNSNLEENRKDHSFRFSGHLFTFTTDTGVFSKRGVDAGSEILLEALEKEDLNGKVLDLGCGYGVLGIVLKKINPDIQITLIDINPRAVELTTINCQNNQVEGTVYESNGFEKIDDTYQTIITNPPIRTGKKEIFKLYSDAYAHLEDGGTFYVVIRKQQGAESTKAYLEELFGNCDILCKSKGYWVLKSHKNSN